MAQSIKKLLSICVNEKDVENAYKTLFNEYYSGCISSPCKTDGILRGKDISALLEFKHSVDLSNPLERAAVIVQCLYYLKNLEINDVEIPKVVFIGDIDECFCIPTSSISDYLKRTLDWTLPPSTAAGLSPELMLEISSDQKIEPFVYVVDDRFDFLDVVEKMKKITIGLPYSISITSHNIAQAFKVFSDYVVLKSDHNLVDVFFTCLTSPGEAYLHPGKKNVLVVRDYTISVKSDRFRAFFQQFKQYNTVVFSVASLDKKS